MRTLTLLVEAEQPDANWIWDNHRDGNMTHGVNVTMIAAGDTVKTLNKECDELAAELEDKPMKKESMVNKIFNDLMHQEVGHDWELLDDIFSKGEDVYTQLLSMMRVDLIGIDWQGKKEEVIHKATKIAECLL